MNPLLPDEMPQIGCPKCGNFRDWVDCEHCEDGIINLHDIDPIYYNCVDDTEICDICNGEGGFLVCQECAKREGER